MWLNDMLHCNPIVCLLTGAKTALGPYQSGLSPCEFTESYYHFTMVYTEILTRKQVIHVYIQHKYYKYDMREEYGYTRTCIYPCGNNRK